MVFVQYGCGFSAGEGWLNFDASPTLWIERIPAIGNLISSIFSGNSARFPDSVKFGDIRKGPLVAPGTARGAYASHVLEHLSLNDFRTAITNTYTMLAPGGVFRLIVPDLLGRAKKYIGDADHDSSAAPDFLRSCLLGKETRTQSAKGAIREFMGNSAHLWMWDEKSIFSELEKVGFVDIRRCTFGDSGINMFNAVEEKSRFHDETWDIDECAIEARKPL